MIIGCLDPWGKGSTKGRTTRRETSLTLTRASNFKGATLGSGLDVQDCYFRMQDFGPPRSVMRELF